MPKVLTIALDDLEPAAPTPKSGNFEVVFGLITGALAVILMVGILLSGGMIHTYDACPNLPHAKPAPGGHGPGPITPRAVPAGRVEPMRPRADDEPEHAKPPSHPVNVPAGIPKD